jgi:glycosyltransferase involved in cell wall biosynthesis
MKKLNICLVALTIPPDSQNGEAKFFRGIYEYLKNQGHNVKLVTAKWKFELSDPNIIQIDIIRRRFFWFPQFNLGVIKYLRNHKFDIIHGNGPKGSLPIILSGKKRLISTIHDLGPFETEFTKIPIEKYIIKYIAQKSNIITTCSEAIKKEIKYYIPNINSEKIFNLYSAIEDKYKPYPEKSKQLKEQLGLNGPVLLYIGRITSYKGVDDIIKAYYKAKTKISNLNLVIGGTPDFSTQKTYEEWKQEYKDIHFAGFIKEDEIPIYYSLGDLFVTYSHASEGFGLTPIESIACGTPVICSNIPAYKEVLQDNAFFVRPQNPELLSQKIIEALRDEELRNENIKKAMKFIQRYTWDYVGKNLEKLYFKFLKSF